MGTSSISTMTNQTPDKKRRERIAEDRGIRIVSGGHAALAATMIVLGIQGLVKGDFTVIWSPVPKGVPGREVLVYLCAVGLSRIRHRPALAAYSRPRRARAARLSRPLVPALESARPFSRVSHRGYLEPR